jgi:P pilus assembly chaperone PapD
MKVSPYLLILLVLTTLVSGTHAAEVTLDRTRYVPGEPITVRFKNAPGNTKDWVGL